MGEARLSLRAGGRFHVRRIQAGIRDGGGQAAGMQRLTCAIVVRVLMARPEAGNAWQALVFGWRCRWRSMTIRRLPRARRVSRWRAVAIGAGRLRGAGPDRVLGRAARRAGGKEISPGWAVLPARRPLRAGAAFRAALRARARVSSVPQIQAACSAVTRAGLFERKIGPADGPAPVIADFASFRAVSDPGHRQA